MDFGKGVAAGMIVMLCGVAGCAESLGTPSVASGDPLLKVPAIESAIRTDDRSHEAQMVADLSSDDSAIRFYSIEGLSRLSGTTYGYHYYDDEDRRQAAVTKWKAWLAAHQLSEAPAAEKSGLGSERVSHTSGGWSTGG